jgi:hypothetical protein
MKQNFDWQMYLFHHRKGIFMFSNLYLISECIPECHKVPVVAAVAVDGKNNMLKMIFKNLIFKQMIFEVSGYIFRLIPENATAPGA